MALCQTLPARRHWRLESMTTDRVRTAGSAVPRRMASAVMVWTQNRSSMRCMTGMPSS